MEIFEKQGQVEPPQFIFTTHQKSLRVCLQALRIRETKKPT